MQAVEHLIDYVNVSAGNYQSFPKMIGGMHEPTGYELPTAIPITKAEQGRPRSSPAGSARSKGPTR